MTAPSPTPGARWRREDLPEDLAELVATLEPNPTYVVGARWDILHANPSAERIFAPWSRVAREQRNLLWFYCRDPRARELFVDWPGEVRAQLRHFRTHHARFSGDPGFERLLARILDGTPEVASWWAQSSLESPPPRRSGVKQVRLGGQVISLRQLVLTSPDDPDVTVISHFADLGLGDELGDDLDLDLEDELDAQGGWRTGR